MTFIYSILRKASITSRWRKTSGKEHELFPSPSDDEDVEPEQYFTRRGVVDPIACKNTEKSWMRVVVFGSSSCKPGSTKNMQAENLGMRLAQSRFGAGLRNICKQKSWACYWHKVGSES